MLQCRNKQKKKCKMLVLNRSKGEIHKVDFSKLTDYIKEGDVICFNDSTIINHMFICKTRQNRLIKIVLEGFLPNNRVIISGLLKERLNANDVFYLVDNPEISITSEHIQSCQFDMFGDCMLIIQDEGQG